MSHFTQCYSHQRPSLGITLHGTLPALNTHTQGALAEVCGVVQGGAKVEGGRVEETIRPGGSGGVKQ